MHAERGAAWCTAMLRHSSCAAAGPWKSSPPRSEPSAAPTAALATRGEGGEQRARVRHARVQLLDGVVEHPGAERSDRLRRRPVAHAVARQRDELELGELGELRPQARLILSRDLRELGDGRRPRAQGELKQCEGGGGGRASRAMADI
ncbi:hypothetical protein GCM10025869_34500 [Homoserinibacter gongjuensis]|uniref:Uncharacterized protein n=1 Tax=Homoserinibacter gongjuensis TaxID=1162968 RepID=A0ABQ6JX87_9MICO|nr:hypothetical protein GCM10025869_34500 [Homoserinibacter gongjuensis]